jgi:hypothetical protein
MTHPTLKSYLNGTHSLKETALYIKEKLAQQGEGAISTSGSCAYRINNKACAIGQIIPDEEYNNNEELFRQMKQGNVDIADYLVCTIDNRDNINDLSIDEYVGLFHTDYDNKDQTKIDHLAHLQAIHDAAACSHLLKGRKFMEHFNEALMQSKDKYLKRILK